MPCPGRDSGSLRVTPSQGVDIYDASFLGAYKAIAPGRQITVTNRLNRKMDWEKWAQICPTFPEHLRPVRAKCNPSAARVAWCRSRSTRPACANAASTCCA